ncbi:MAG: BamA/TamA family outer membrane protein, partial [Elusimicrobia bacterium]|nr:BamA/TamA family outer membrane protein [Elusimicrobiota bacterium]
KNRALLAVLILATAARVARAIDPDGDDMMPARAVVPTAAERKNDDETPPFLRWMLAPLKRGMFVRLPIIDTDPNRGITYGVMPIVVLQGKHDDRIQQIHAPSVTYNKDFGVSPTYRYYYYPEEDASFLARVSRAKFEHEVMLEYEDHSFAGTDYDVFLRLQENADAGQRFFGIGPNTPKSMEANYKEQYWHYRWGVGVPFGPGSPWRAHISQRYQASRITNGPIPNLVSFDQTYPEQIAEHAQQTNETRINLDYDTRDHAVTTGRGAYFNAFAETSISGYMSQYDYQRYGLYARWFKPSAAGPDRVFAAQFQYEQIMGATPPFWLLPSLGGKYSLRAYGDGRYVDRGVAAVNIEERFKVFEAKTAGVVTELQVAPFAGVGQAFDNPGRAAARYARPVVGTAFRAVAKPQVVGSVDVGVGREGVSVFTDINYSF